MLSLKIGEFYPELENALLQEIRDLKREDPFCQVAVVVPSGWLRRHILRRMASTLGPTAGIHLLTLFGFASRMVEEGVVSRMQDVPASLHRGYAASPFVLEHLVGFVIRKKSHLLPWLRNVRDFSGAASAVLRAIEDLRDANVSPERLAEATAELQAGDIGSENLRRLRELNLVYAEYSRQVAACGLADDTDIFQTATQAAANSAYLRSFKRIIFYGFYDLTTVQYDFIEAVQRDFETSFFMPYKLQSAPSEKGEEIDTVSDLFKDTRIIQTGRQSATADSGFTPFAFARELYGLLRGRAAQLSNLAAQPSTPNVSAAIGPLAKSFFDPVMRLSQKGGLRLVSAAGANDEVWFAAKEILSLIEREKYAPEDIAVVTRTLEPYAAIIDAVFRTNRIAYVTSAEEPVCRYPLAKTIVQLATLAVDNFPRSAVIDLLSSVYVDRDKLCGITADIRPDVGVWDTLSRKLAIARGVQEWIPRLSKLIERKGVFDSEDEEKGVVPPKLALKQATLLLKAVQWLETRFNAFPARAGFAQFSETLRNLILDAIKLSEISSEREKTILKTILDGLTELALLEVTGEEVTREEFTEDFVEWVRRARLSMGVETGRGVRVLDVMTARGSNFAVVFLLGMNARVFPRIVREEPFLKDAVRRALSDILGVRVPQKLKGIEEEKLLFRLVLNSARDVLYIVYQRSDEKGSVRVRSLYVEAVREALLGARISPRENVSLRREDVKVPRGLRGKLVGTENLNCLAPIEAQLRELLLPRNNKKGLDVLPADTTAFAQTKRALKRIEGYGSLCKFDGVKVRIDRWWKNKLVEGFSPTSLEQWRKCPFIFLVNKVMNLRPLEEPEEVESAEVLFVGRLYHNILKNLYESLEKSGYFVQPGGKGDLLAMLREIATEEFEKFEEHTAVGYPLLWEAQKRKILQDLETFVPADIARLKEDDVTPLEFELDGNCKVELGTHEPLLFRGRLDRLDVNEGTGKFIVSDYKSGRMMLTSDLQKLALKCEGLQAPLYFLMAEEFLKARQKVDRAASEVRFLFVRELAETGFKSGKQFFGSFWDKEGSKFAERLAVLTGAIRKGFFPPSPSPDVARRCDGACAFRTACRRGHPPSRYRVENSVEIQEILSRLKGSEEERKE